MILNGKPIVEKKLSELKERVDQLEKKPKLCIIRVGNDPASEKYVNNKVKRCKEVGIVSEVIHLVEDVDSYLVETYIKCLNEDEDTTAILLQLPLPKHLDEEYLTSLIDPEKDVDGFTEANMGKLMLGKEGNVACTPTGIIELLKHYNIEIEGKDVLIINRSNIVGKPLAHLFLKENATVTIAHSKTKRLQDKINASDIIVTAIGKQNAFNHLNFFPHQTIVDVSINFDENGKICGDLSKDCYEELENMHCNFTPVPGGIGQMTVLSLIEQTVRIAEKNS